MLVWEDNVSNQTTPTIRAALEPSREARPMDSSPLAFQSQPALPSVPAKAPKAMHAAAATKPATSTRRVNAVDDAFVGGVRSEERRVGKECLWVG